MMDDVTGRRHRNRPDYTINLSATGVRLPNGRVSWRLTFLDIATPEGDKPTFMWWARLFTDWAKTFLRKGLRNKN